MGILFYNIKDWGGGIMKIDLRPLSGNIGEKVSFDFQEEINSDRLQEGAPWLKKIERVSGTIESQGERFLLTGEIAFQIFCICDRCLKEIHREETIPFSEKISEGEIGKKDDMLQIEGDWVEIFPMVEDYLLLSVPSQRLCTEDCQGLCENCGCDLNEGSCECKKEDYNPKFGKLAILKDRLS